VIVRDLDIVSIPVPPDKTNSILIVDPNTVLTRPIPFQRFQPVGRRNAKICEGCGVINHQKLSQSYLSHAGRGIPPALSGFPKNLRFRVGEALDHADNYNAKR
jgi:hypothetical protein